MGERCGAGGDTSNLTALGASGKASASRAKPATRGLRSAPTPGAAVSVNKTGFRVVERGSNNESHVVRTAL
jgi:hypothetical protein